MAMRRAAWLIVIAIAGLINGIASLQIEVLVNESTFIDCHPNKKILIQWHHTPPGKSSTNAYVYAGGRFHRPYNTGRFRLTNNNFTLVIDNVTDKDAGLYDCRDDIGSGVFGLTHLTVLDSSPVCTSNMIHNGFVGPNMCNLEEETMTFNCAVSFSGNTPILKWRSLNGSQTLNSSVCEIRDNRIDCSLSIKADASFDGYALICQTTAAAADDAPYNCSIEDITVEYFFSDFDNVEKTVNDKVSCPVTSNLQIRYNWTLQKKDRLTFLGANRTIVIENPGLHECVVEYSIRNATCFHLVAVVNASNRVDSKDDSLTIPHLIVITVSVIAAAVIAAVVIKAKTKPPPNIDPIRLTKICDVLKFDELLNQLTRLKAIGKEDVNEDVEGNRIAKLVEVIANRKNFNLLKKAVANINKTLAGYLTKGEIITVDVNTSRPGLDVSLSEALNTFTAQQPKLFSKLNDHNISVVASKLEDSIKVFIYCSDIEDMTKFTEIFNSGQLEGRLNDVMKELLPKIEQPESTEAFVTRVSINEDEVSAIEKLIGQQDCFRVYTGIGKSSDGSKSYFSVYNLDKIQSDEELPEGGNEDGTLRSDSDRSLPIQLRELSPALDRPEIKNASEQEMRKNDLDEYADHSFSIPPNGSEHRPIQNERAVGMTILKNELFVVYKSCSVIESCCCEKYEYTDYRRLEGMNNPEDIASCPMRECLYILNTDADKSTVEILQIDPKTSSIKAKWKIKGSHGRISVSKGVIVVSFLHEKRRHVIEYNPDLSSFRRFTINDNASESPLRVLKNNSHRFLCLEEYAEPSTEVNLFLVDGRGDVLQKTPISDANKIYAQHFHLITDTNGNAIFADKFENQIRGYDSNLENGKVLISAPFIINPDLIALNEYDKRLFVLYQVGKSVHIQVFSTKRQKS